MKLKFLVRLQVMILDGDEDDYNNKNNQLWQCFFGHVILLLELRLRHNITPSSSNRGSNRIDIKHEYNYVPEKLVSVQNAALNYHTCPSHIDPSTRKSYR